PGNSMGAVEYMVAGFTEMGTTNRALMRFDVASVIPTGSLLREVEFFVAVTKQASNSPRPAPFGLRRMLRSWGEGDNYYIDGPGLGEPADPGDATWMNRFFSTNAWAVPGGAEGIDYAEAITSSTEINGLGEFPFEGTPQMLEDVRMWIENPGTNFGWMLKSEEENPEGTTAAAKRFASREDPGNAPRLVITYTPPPLITAPQLTNGAIQFSFDAEANGIYSVEERAAFEGTNLWNTITNFGFVLEPTNFTARISMTSTQRFFRVHVD
ncbi:MAG TPA: DNRLRE domain-containing protein, partial [Candidatus Acidoferrum sp.]|nr:DNRLRE domain-containing protein [Candidatus Acidoferrum sp.]